MASSRGCWWEASAPQRFVDMLKPLQLPSLCAGVHESGVTRAVRSGSREGPGADRGLEWGWRAQGHAGLLVERPALG